MSKFDLIIEQHIKKAQKEGAFDNLPGAGKPLNLNDGYEDAPAESRMAFKILKNAGYMPEDMQIRKDIEGLKALVKEIPESEAERKHQLMIKLNESYARYYAVQERSKKNP